MPQKLACDVKPSLSGNVEAEGSANVVNVNVWESLSFVWDVLPGPVLRLIADLYPGVDFFPSASAGILVKEHSL